MAGFKVGDLVYVQSAEDAGLIYEKDRPIYRITNITSMHVPGVSAYNYQSNHKNQYNVVNTIYDGESKTADKVIKVPVKISIEVKSPCEKCQIFSIKTTAKRIEISGKYVLEHFYVLTWSNGLEDEVGGERVKIEYPANGLPYNKPVITLSSARSEVRTPRGTYDTVGTPRGMDSSQRQFLEKAKERTNKALEKATKYSPFINSGLSSLTPLTLTPRTRLGGKSNTRKNKKSNKSRKLRRKSNLHK